MSPFENEISFLYYENVSITVERGQSSLQSDPTIMLNVVAMRVIHLVPPSLRAHTDPVQVKQTGPDCQGGGGGGGRVARISRAALL